MSDTFTYRVAIIGAGRIGCGFDTPDSRLVLTHAHAIKNNPRLTLVALVDADRERGEREAVKWGTEHFVDIDQMFVAAKPDVVVIATPDTTHMDVLLHVLAKRPKLIVCEKPAVTDRKESQRLRDAVAQISIPIVVNFNRRFDSTVQEIRKELIQGKYGAVISARSVYVRGAIHNGCHLFDFARMFFGELEHAVPDGVIYDYTDTDPTIGGFARFERCPRLYIQPADGRHFSIFEFDILCEKKRISFVEEGFNVVVQEVIADPVFAGYSVLGEPRREKTHLAEALSELAAHVVQVLDGEEALRSSLEEALKTQEICFAFNNIIKKEHE